MTDEAAVPGHGTTHDTPGAADEPGAGHTPGDGAVHDTPDGGHHDSHAAHDHGGMGLGPIDWTAWGIGIVGVAAGLATAVCFALSTGLLG